MALSSTAIALYFPIYGMQGDQFAQRCDRASTPKCQEEICSMSGIMAPTFILSQFTCYSLQLWGQAIEQQKHGKSFHPALMPLEFSYCLCSIPMKRREKPRNVQNIGIHVNSQTVTTWSNFQLFWEVQCKIVGQHFLSSKAITFSFSFHRDKS